MLGSTTLIGVDDAEEASNSLIGHSLECLKKFLKNSSVEEN